MRLAGSTWGDPAARPVILLHGGGQTRHAWRGTGATLARDGYFVLAYDARGHGDSDWDPAGRYDPDSLVADLVEVVASLDGPPPALVGASMGGNTALIAVGEGSVLASALVLVDIAPVIEPVGQKRIHDFMSQDPDGFATLEEVADAIARYQPKRPRPASTEGLAKNVRLGNDGRYHWHWDPRILDGPADLTERQERLEEISARLTVPTLLVRGGLSDLLSEEGARRFLKVCPQAAYVRVADAAHMVAGDRNDAFTEAVTHYLDSLDL